VASRLYLAEIARKQGRLTHELIQPLLKQIHETGFKLILQTESFFLQKLYAECVRHGWLAEIFKPFLNEYKTTKAQQYTLKVNTLGVLEVTLNDKPIEFPYIKVTELLVYLCLHGSVSRAELSEMLWEDPRPSHVHNAIKHLRQSLSKAVQTDHPLIVLEQKRYMLDQSLKVTLDITALEKLESDDAPQVLALYRGDFLAGIETDWVQPMRERYRQFASSLAERYADSFKTSEPEIALGWYKRAVGIDPESVNAIEAIVKLAGKLGLNHDAQLARTALEYLERGENPGVLLKEFAEAYRL
jgi:two-component SAPR family response regulator